MFARFLSRLLSSASLIVGAIILLLIAGVATYRGLRVDLFPPLNFPILNVITEVPTFSSFEMERQVTLPIESAVGGVLGVTKVRSTSATAISMVSAEFEWGTNMLTARQLLIESMSQLREQLPPNTSPTIENLSATLAMIEGYSFLGGQDLVKLRDMAVYDLRPRLQRIPGVYKVIVMGGKVSEYAVYPNPFLMIKYDVTLDDLKGALADNNILAAPGVVNDNAQEFALHANGQFANETEIGNVVIAVKNGIPILIHDVARVSKAFQYERGDTSEKQTPSVLINIYKQPNFDTGVVADAIAEEISAFRERLPKEMSIHNYYDQAQLVRDSIGSVKESVWIGALLVVLVILMFLRNIRTTLIATLSIPLSVIAALVLMRLLGIGLNIMSLGGLAIGTGIIVDDAIVVLENIFRWFSTADLRENQDRIDIIINATAEVVRPVVVSTLTNIGIFLPMVFVAGFAGRLFSPVSFTVTFALLASLIVSLTVIPLLAEKWITTGSAHKNGIGRLYQIYSRSLSWALSHSRTVLCVGLVPVALSALAFRRFEVEFLPSLDEGAILLNAIMPAGTSLGEAKRVGLKIENWLAGVPGVQTVVRRTGHAPGAEDTDNVNHSDIMVKLLPKRQRPLSLGQFIDALNTETSKLPSIQINYLMPLADKINDALGGVPTDIGLDFFGPDLTVLHGLAEKLIEQMRPIKGLVNLHPPYDLPVPSVEIKIDKKEAGRLGISERVIFDAFQAYSVGLEATRVRETQKEIRVVVHFALAGESLNMESLKSLPLKTTGGNTVPLEQVAKLSYGEVPSEIYHEHLSRKITITTNVSGRNTDDAAKDIQKAIAALKLPTGYSWGFSGRYRTEQNALSNMGVVLLLAVAVVAFILWIGFRSLIQVGLILLTIPLAAVGAFLSLWVCHQSLNISSMIGAVMLVGIVVRNGIMLIDYMNRERKKGQPLTDAVRSAALKRVRPILMTASVTILGLFPIATGWGTGSELLRPLAVAVIGGILTSTLLTLLILPAATIISLKRTS